MPKQVTHPLTGQVYRLTEDGLVEVTDPARTGARASSTSRPAGSPANCAHADLQMAGWVGRLPSGAVPGRRRQ